MTDRTNFAEILDGYLRSLEAGSAPDREVLLAKHPDIAEELRAALLGIDFVHGAAPRLAPEAQADALPGGLLGDYRLIRELGRGGMAVVYEAEQVSLGRRVALKVMPFAAVLDPKQLQRFKNEAMAAAHLHHSNIVPVYGVGCERGVHYYAMQYIEGQSLATAIRGMKGGSSSLGDGPPTPISSHGSNREPAYIRMAARLGVQAAEALDHAHQLGIVHRDVKPGNLLADLVGRLWVTDFGLASSKNDVGLTITGELLGTIRYMSPEQALAKRVPVDHRTDVYSLGATLYELFTLEPAFPGDNPHLVIQDIAFKEPPLPRRLNPALPRDLETVILKAMWKDPSGRYATAQEMADDLTRFLENRPIEAKRAGLIRRASKWSRRHRSFVGATLVLLLLSIAGLAIGTGLLWREKAQTTAAYNNSQANLSLALQALDQIYIEESQGHPKLREGLSRDLLLRGLGFYQKFIEANAGNEMLISLKGTAYQRAGLIFRELGEEAHAVESLEGAVSAYDRALQLDPRNMLANHNRGIALAYLGRFEEALAAHTRSLEINPRDADAHNSRGAELCDNFHRPADALVEFDLAIGLQPDLASAHSNRGNALAYLRRYDDALKAHNRAIELDPTDAGFHNSRAALYKLMGRLEDALADCDKALELDDRHALAHANRGALLHSLGRDEQALAAYDRAVQLNLRNALVHTSHGDTLWSVGRPEQALAAFDKALAIDSRNTWAHNGRGLALLDLGRLDEALAAHDRALEINPQQAGALTGRGNVLKDMGCPAESLAAMDRAVEFDPRDVVALNARGIALQQLGRIGEALAAYDRASQVDPGVVLIHLNRGALLCDFLHEPDEALAAFDRAIAIDPLDIRIYHNRCVALGALGRFEAALACSEQYIEISPGDSVAHADRASALCQLDRFDAALEECDQAIALDRGNVVAHLDRGRALNNLGRFDEALAACDLAIAIDKRAAWAHFHRGNALYMLKRYEEALKAHDRAIALDPTDARLAGNRAAIAKEVARSRIEGRLDKVLAGEAQPRNARERTELAEALYRRSLHAEAARMFAQAFAEKPALAEDLANSYRYDAACSAVLAAARGGTDAAESRGRALEWLRADLAARERARSGLVVALEHWQVDPDFASVRDRLGDLPEPERAAWSGLWAAVDLALTAARGATK